MKLYLTGSLRNEMIPIIANQLRDHTDYEVFDDWFAAGPEADDYWQKYEKARGRTFAEALDGHSARNVFQFDLTHLQRADVVVLVMPAGKSGHLELGWCMGQGKRGFILLDGEPERFDTMYQFTRLLGGSVLTSVDDLIKALNAKQ